jgi:hypothetical protein
MMDLKLTSQISVLVSKFLAFVFITVWNVTNVTVYRKILPRLYNSMRHCFIVMCIMLLFTLCNSHDPTRHLNCRTHSQVLCVFLSRLLSSHARTVALQIISPPGSANGNRTIDRKYSLNETMQNTALLRWFVSVTCHVRMVVLKHNSGARTLQNRHTQSLIQIRIPHKNVRSWKWRKAVFGTSVLWREAEVIR